MFISNFQQIMPCGVSAPKKQNSITPPEVNLPRVVQYPADYSGCGQYRMVWPGSLLNAHQKAMVQESTVMVLEPQWYTQTKMVRVQRQATTHQKAFIEFLSSIKDQVGFRLVYEIDDVVFREDIPDYNKFKPAFVSDEIRETSEQIMKLCDEITVTNEFMRDYFREKTGKREITVIPNFLPRWWIGNYFNPQKVNKNFDTYRKKPRVLYAGSGAHFDIEGRANHKDDFEHVVKSIIDTRKEFQWIFIGAFPKALQSYIMANEIEFHPWQKFYDFPQKIYDLDIQMLVASLQDNNFNRCKSDIKFIEACMFGLPIACQDMVTYKDAHIKFKTGEEMIDCLRKTLKNSKSYRDDIYLRRKVAEDRFLEHDRNIDCYLELALHPYGSDKRINLSKYNKSI